MSGYVYFATLIAATLMVFGLAAIASMQAAFASRDLRALDLRIAILRGSGVGSGIAGIDIDQDIEETLDTIMGPPEPDGPSTLVAVTRDGHDSLVPVPASVAHGRAEVVLKELSRARTLLVHASERVWGAVTGPIVTGGAFLGIAGAMLPGSDGFAAVHFQLNTTVILFLGYGWPFLVAWAVSGLALARGQNQRHA